MMFGCDAIGCERPADWAYIGEGGDLYLCEFHGGNEDIAGWHRIGPQPPSLPDRHIGHTHG
jgi:hypothetical protein